jgi:two-component sensor histidine kinase
MGRRPRSVVWIGDQETLSVNTASNSDAGSRANEHATATIETLTDDLAQERARRERAESRESGLLRILSYKDALVQEVNHRVKNTLQIAASVLAVQARATASEEARSALRQSRDRLHLLAYVHELLYRSAHGKQEIPMAVLLRAIGDGLRESFGEMSERVTLHIESDPAVLSPEDAIPVALLTNEALTNCYKHAFPRGSSGEIRVNLTFGTDGLILQVRDNGIGMRSSSLQSGIGLTLIQSLAAQVRGTLTIAKPIHASGTVMTLMFHPGSPQVDGPEQSATEVITWLSQSSGNSTPTRM